MIKPHSLRFATAIVLLFLVTACSTGGEDALGGDGLPVKSPSETYEHTVGVIDGVLTLEPNGCWTIDLGDGQRLAVFPTGFTKDDSGSLMASADAEIAVGSGDEVTARGGVAPAAGFPGVPDGYWGNYLTFCKPAIEEFVVMDEILRVTG